MLSLFPETIPSSTVNDIIARFRRSCARACPAQASVRQTTGFDNDIKGCRQGNNDLRIIDIGLFQCNSRVWGNDVIGGFFPNSSKPRLQRTEHNKGDFTDGAILPILTSIAAVVAVAYAVPAYAAGPYDGNWVIDAPPAGGAIGSEGQYTCPALRIPFTSTMARWLAICIAPRKARSKPASRPIRRPSAVRSTAMGRRRSLAELPRDRQAERQLRRGELGRRVRTPHGTITKVQ